MYPFFGIENDDRNQIMCVHDPSPAMELGFRSGDTITHINGETIVGNQSNFETPVVGSLLIASAWKK